MGNVVWQMFEYLNTAVEHKSTTDSSPVPEVAQSQPHATPRHLMIEGQRSLIPLPTEGPACQALSPGNHNPMDWAQTSAESSVSAAPTELYILYERIRHLESSLEKQKAKYHRHAQHYQDWYKRIQLQNESLQLKLVHARQECEKLQIDNVELREHINNTRGSKPVHADDQYVKIIEHLNEKTKSWIAGLSKSGKAGDIQHEMGVVIEALGTTGYGRDVLNTLGENTKVLANILGDRRRRMACIRHLLWMEITESIIQPFAFGLTDGHNELLSKALEKMMQKGIHSASLELIRRKQLL